ncbi:MAG: M20/M25/M40 family metallo-hydrolase [Bacillota bacterium]|nr:M20/M25/M40 family metallo-hydrolase [Bacillota bacterium]
MELINQKRLIDSFCRMVSIGSPSGKEGAFRDYLKKAFVERGLQVREDNAAALLGGQSGNLVVEVPGTIEGPSLLLAAHMDTVVPGDDIQPVIGEDGIIRSAGNTILGSDDKAGIAAILEAYDVMKENHYDHPPLEILLTVGEEQGLQGAKAFDFTQLESQIGYTLDSGGRPGGIVVQSPCQYEMEYIVQGKAAHAGINPEDGINAIQVMARALAKMPCGRMDEKSTCNFGTIQGGQARNIVAESCRVKGEARSLNRSKLDELAQRLESIFTEEVSACGAQAECHRELLYTEISLDENERVVDLAVRAAEKAGISPDLQSTGGGSDASVINGAGIRCANLGIGMSDVHTTHEYIKIKDLVDDARWVVEIIRAAANREEDM